MTTKDLTGRLQGVTTEDQPAAEVEGLSPNTERAVILFVDSEEGYFEKSESALRHAYHLVQAKTDREACAHIRNHPQELVAILMDVDMPGSVIDGVLLTRILRKKVPDVALPPFARGLPELDIPIMLLTSSDEDYSEQELTRYGGYRLLTKPVAIHSLTLALANWHLRPAP